MNIRKALAALASGLLLVAAQTPAQLLMPLSAMTDGPGLQCAGVAPEQAPAMGWGGEAPLSKWDDNAVAVTTRMTDFLDDHLLGLFPSDYVSPIEHVREVGHLRHEVLVHMPYDKDQVRMEQVLSFDAPEWARMMLVEFVPDSGQGGLFLRPHNPFVGGTFPAPNHLRHPEMDASAYAQAAYRSDGRDGALSSRFKAGVPQYLLITQDMDPAPAGKQWHVAITQHADAGEFDEELGQWIWHDLKGTLTVRFSGSNYRPPLALKLFYNPEEEAAQVGLFDPTPYEPDGDNPAQTRGEAMRWALFRAAEDLLEEVNLDGFLPLPVRVSVRPQDYVGRAYAARSHIRPDTPAPGRNRARSIGAGPNWPYTVPLVAYERESGTDRCRAQTDLDDTRRCAGQDLRSHVGLRSGGRPSISVYREAINLSEGSPQYGEWWRWDMNWKDRPDDPGYWPATSLHLVFKHELAHIIGFEGAALGSNAYRATFDPPRPQLEAPPYTQPPPPLWWGSGTLRHFYGPRSVASPHNPWAHTAEPGPRLQDGSVTYGSHLMMAGHELPRWDTTTTFMMPGPSPFYVGGMGMERDMLLDMGYARDTWAVQERGLPRHWFDPERSGHGLDLRRVEQADGSVRHFLHFYSYDELGHPEWYIATAELNERAVFEGDLDYVTYDPTRTPAAQIDPARSGTIRLDLDPAINHPACAERRGHQPADRGKWLFAVLDFDLPAGSGQWCLEPLQFGREPAFPHEGTGSWYASDPEDSGWGLSIMTRNRGPRPIIHTVAYYYDSNGEPTWAIGTGGGDYTLPYRSVGEGVEIDMLHVHGFCRTCEPQATPTVPAGTMRLRINEQSTEAHPGNWIERLDLTDQSPAGGRWLREDIGIRLLSSPHPNMSQ